MLYVSYGSVFTDRDEQNKYNTLLFDFKYLNSSELQEQRIQSNPQDAELDTEFRESHMEILTRFYKLFESVYKYIKVCCLTRHAVIILVPL